MIQITPAYDADKTGYLCRHLKIKEAAQKLTLVNERFLQKNPPAGSPLLPLFFH
jgi:hypothetical protein